MIPKNNQITFKKFSKKYVPLFYKWAEIPFVKNTWFQEGYEPKEKILEKIKGNGYDYPFLILLDNKPIGYIQYADLFVFLQKNPFGKTAYENIQPGDVCVDLFIGEKNYLNQGYGTEIVTQFTDWLLKKPKIKKILIDPSTENKRAIRCYEKAGFRLIQTKDDGVEMKYIMEKRTLL